MAYQMIHMEVGYRLLEKISKLECPAEFLLGCVAPDSVHMNPEYDVKMKVHSHMFEGCGPWGDTRDYERWMDNIHTVFKQYTLETEHKSPYEEFILGMCVHCLTDYYNDLNIWRKLQKENIPPMDTESFREDYYPEARGIDLWLYQHSMNTANIRELLSAATIFEVDDFVRKSDMERMKEHLLEVQYDAQAVDLSNYRYMNAKTIEIFVEQTVKDIAEIIGKWKLG